MSGDIFSTSLINSNDKHVITYKEWISIEINRDDICTFNGDCKIDNVVQNKGIDLCKFCIHLKRIDIPHILDEQNKNES